MQQTSFQNFISLGKTALRKATIFVILSLAPYAQAVEIPNPIAAKSFTQLIQNLAVAIRDIALPLAAVAIIFAGFKFITGAVSGDAKALGEAKKMLWWVLIGTAIVVGASVLTEAIINTLQTTF